MAENTQVTLAWPLERDGVNHKAGSTIPVPNDEAAALVRSGLARTPNSSPAAEVVPDGTELSGDELVAVEAPATKRAAARTTGAESTPDAAAPAVATPAPKGK